MADVASIRSTYLREATLARPTALERATTAARQAPSFVAQAFLANSAAIEAQIISTRLAGDITSAFINAAQVQAAYGASVALVQDAQGQSSSGLNVSA